MRRAINWFVVLLSISILMLGLAMTGCSSAGDGNRAEPDDPLADSGMLRPVRNAAELESLLKDAITGVAAGGIPGTSIDAPAVTQAAFSTTYTLEAGVDELDMVRFDGTHLFVAPEFTGLPQSGQEIRILRTDRASATATQVGRLALDPDQYVMGMYVVDGRLFLVTTENYFGPFGGVWPAIVLWGAPSRFTVQVYDVRDPAHPNRLRSATADGVFVASRRIGDRVVLVSRFTPRALHDESLRGRLQQIPLGDLLPAISIDGHRESLLNPRNCYVSDEPDAQGYPVLTSITTFSLADPAEFDGICFDEAADGVYASQDALYVSEPRYGTGYAMSTRIHKFALAGSRARYAGSAELPGAMWGNGQSDFRINESAGLLRVMTSDPTGDLSDAVDHRLFVLRQKPAERALEVIGQLPNAARPEEIGKPNEGLFGVRFSGDRAYAVTFQRIDPLYVIDLSTPTDPSIAGQLLLPGVSEFLHPVSRDLLLGLGREAGRVKVELYDTSVLESPQSRGALSLGGVTSFSPAVYDRHVFTYLAGADSDRFAFPAFITDPQSGLAETSLHQFEIHGKSMAPSASLQEAGAMALPESAGQLAFSNRAFIDGDTVYYVRDGQVWSAFWATPTQVNGPF